MAKVFICDRCGKIINDYPVSLIAEDENFAEILGLKKRIDLCSECSDIFFTDFLKSEENSQNLHAM